MPFAVPGQQQPQPQPQQREGRGGGMERRDYASQQPGPAYRPPQQQRQQRGGGYDPWQQQRQQQYRQPQMQRPQYQQAPQPQPYRDPYGQRGGGRQYQQPMPYDTRQQRQYESPMRQEPMYSNRPQQGTYVGDGVYADGTPMPPMPSSGYNGQSLIQSNAGPAGGVYSNFNQTPEVNGGVTPRAYLEEDDVYNKPMYTRRGGGGIY
jgi:hypothetical protein